MTPTEQASLDALLVEAREMKKLADRLGLAAAQIVLMVRRLQSETKKREPR